MIAIQICMAREQHQSKDENTDVVQKNAVEGNSFKHLTDSLHFEHERWLTLILFTVHHIRVIIPEEEPEMNLIMTFREDHMILHAA